MLGLMRGLAAHGVDARALTVDSRRHYVPPPPLDIGAESAYVEYPGVWRGRRDRLLAPYSAFARGDFGRRVRELSDDADVVHLSGISGGMMIPLIRRPVVVQLDNLTLLDRDLGPPWTHQGRIDLETLRAERTTRRRARWLLANSAPVARELARVASHAEVRRAPLSLDPAYYPGRADLTEPVAGLIGTASWPPTADAVRRLLTHVWPLVLQRRPSARLLLAGRGMDPAGFSDLPALSGVEWLGEVDSAEAFLQGLGVLLYPVGRGSGAKIKVLESMLLGLPVVTTPPGAEGIDGGDALIVETDDEALAEATCALLEDDEARRRTGEAVRRAFDAHHAPAKATTAVIEVYEQMIR
jgi:glycosyltransferase involved in cell wall biosynthesis